MSITARRQIRLLTVAAVQTLTGVTVLSPGDWETPPKNLPEIKVRAPSDRKVSAAKSAPNFTTTVTVEILARVSGVTDVAALDAIEALGAQIEDAVFGMSSLIAVIQQVASVSTQTLVTADGASHIGAALMSVDFEVFEAFDPSSIAGLPTLQQILVNVDTVHPFDAAGTYTSLPFPASVTAAPRTAGPDGRNEATLQITLPI